MIRSLLLLLLLICPAAWAEEAAHSAEAESKPSTPNGAIVVEKERPRVTAGLFFGRLYFIHPDGVAITVRPIDPTLPRKRFYLDRKTYYKNVKKKGSLKDLELGQKVAVRFVQRDSLALADAVFIVDGEFNRSDYLPKRVAAPKAEGEKEGEKKAEHGAEKKEEKAPEKPKKGGGH